MTSTPSGSDSQSLPQIKMGKKFWIYALIGVAVVVLLQIRSLGDWWNLLFFEPMLNSLLFLYRLLGRSFALSIIVFTLLVKLITLPFTIKQLETTKKTQEIQGKVEALKKKYGDDKEKLNQETMKLYQEAAHQPDRLPGTDADPVSHLDRHVSVHSEHPGDQSLAALYSGQAYLPDFPAAFPACALPEPLSLGGFGQT